MQLCAIINNNIWRKEVRNERGRNEEEWARENIMFPGGRRIVLISLLKVFGPETTSDWETSLFGGPTDHNKTRERESGWRSFCYFWWFSNLLIHRIHRQFWCCYTWWDPKRPWNREGNFFFFLSLLLPPFLFALRSSSSSSSSPCRHWQQERQLELNMCVVVKR